MKDGLGMRWALLGPMETIHLNADGIKNYCEKYGNTIYNISSELGDIPSAWKMSTQEEKDEVTFKFYIDSHKADDSIIFL